MMLCRTFIALALLMLFSTNVHAQGSNSWSAGYPKTGTVAQTILVKGKAVVDAGWALKTPGLVVVWPVGGGAAFNYGITINANGTWGELAVGAGDLTSGVNYNVLVRVNEKNGAATKTLLTDTQQAVAK